MNEIAPAEGASGQWIGAHEAAFMSELSERRPAAAATPDGSSRFER